MIRVLLVDDHPATRDGVRRALAGHPEIEVVGEAGTVADALRLSASLAPDVAVLDVDLPDGSGADVARELLGTDTRVLVFSAHAGRGFVRALLEAGAAGYLTKDSPASELRAAVEAVARGEGRWHVVPVVADDPVGALTDRERDVVSLLARGLSNADIAETLFVSVSTVQNTLTTVYSKIGVAGSREAVVWAWEQGLGPNAP